jgi:hypothetical protein
MKTLAILLFVFATAIFWSTVNAQSQEAESDALIQEAETDTASDDWDWSEIEAMDDTPISSKQVIRKDVTEVSSQRLTAEESASPDLETEAHLVYSLFKDMPSFHVIPSKKDKEMYPCMNCHNWVKSNLEPRLLEQPHDNFELKHGLHGKGQFWCFTCHDNNDKGMLKTLQGEYVAFEDAYIICSQCHVNEARDWAYGVHGKRLDTWNGKRQVYNCTACHYQHGPAFKKRDAMPGPEMRMGLQRPEHWVSKDKRDVVVHAPVRPWQSHHASEAVR